MSNRLQGEIIPDNWITVSFGELATFQGGSQPPKSQFIDSYKPGYIRLIQIRDFTNDNNIVYIPDSSKLKKCKSDDILIARYGASVGKICTGKEGAYNVALIKCEINEQLVDRRWFYWLLHTETLQRAFKGTLRAAQAGFNQEELYPIQISLPPKAEQERIVKKIEWAIENLRNIDQKLSRAQLLLSKRENSLLLKAFSGSLVKQIQEEGTAENLIRSVEIDKEKTFEKIADTEIPYNIPSSWAWIRLSEIGELARGKSKHRPRNDPKLFENGNYPLVQTGDVARSDGIITSFTSLYNEEGVKQSRLWSKGTVCITIAANIADTGVLDFDACFPDSVVGFIPDFGPPEYYEKYIRSIKKELDSYSSSTAQKNINLSILNKVMVPIPPLNEMNRIVEKLNEEKKIQNSILENIEKGKMLLSKMRDSILQKAFKGELVEQLTEEGTAQELLDSML